MRMVVKVDSSALFCSLRQSRLMNGTRMGFMLWQRTYYTAIYNCGKIPTRGNDLNNRMQRHVKHSSYGESNFILKAVSWFFFSKHWLCLIFLFTVTSCRFFYLLYLLQPRSHYSILSRQSYEAITQQRTYTFLPIWRESYERTQVHIMNNKTLCYMRGAAKTKQNQVYVYRQHRTNAKTCSHDLAARASKVVFALVLGQGRGNESGLP